MTSIPMTGRTKAGKRHRDRTAPHLAVQIIGLVLFGGFAITSTVLAFVFFWPAGFALAVILGWIGFGPILHPRHWQAVPAPIPSTVEPALPATGNATFDAYRADVLERLQDEQYRFTAFLDRLRDAKDKLEFDRFMDDRAALEAADGTLPVRT